jgi:hypothetical protein
MCVCVPAVPTRACLTQYMLNILLCEATLRHGSQLKYHQTAIWGYSALQPQCCVPRQLAGVTASGLHASALFPTLVQGTASGLHASALFPTLRQAEQPRCRWRPGGVMHSCVLLLLLLLLLLSGNLSGRSFSPDAAGLGDPPVDKITDACCCCCCWCCRVPCLAVPSA